MKRRSGISILVIIAVVIIAIILINRTPADIEKETAQCIGENSVLYIQTGCHACATQEELFGDNFQYLNVIDCWIEEEKCSDIVRVPTWIINEEQILGVQSIEKLKELTGCE